MKKPGIKRGLSLILGALLMIQTPAYVANMTQEVYAYTERPATVGATSLNIRSGAGTTYSVSGKLAYGAAVMVIGEETGSDGKSWYQIRYSTGSGEKTGYALGTYIHFPVNYTKDSDFEAYLSAQGFPESYKDGLRQIHAEYPSWVFVAEKTGLDWNDVITNESVVGRNLVYKTSVSSWKSTASGAYDWDNGTWPGFDSSAWVAASEDIIRYYMDPRNFLNTKYLFQFLTQGYDSSAHNTEGLSTMLNGTFLEGSTASIGSSSDMSFGSTSGPGGSSSVSGQSSSPAVIIKPTGGSSANVTPSESYSGTDETISSGQAPQSGNNSGVELKSPSASITVKNSTKIGNPVYGPGMDTDPSGSSDISGAPSSGDRSYNELIMQAAEQSGVNPYVLAAMIIQEQGTKGTSGLISGTYGGYSGYYNFFNIEAYQSGSMTATERGLWYASQSGSYGRPWNTVEKAISGGSVYYGENYVKVGQDTFYLKKFNVQGNNLYKHQYMTNVEGAAAEGAKLAEAYSDSLKNTALQFRIPVYSGMPETACVQPTTDGSPNNKLSGLGVEGFSLTPTFSRDASSYDLIVDESVSSVTVNASAIDAKAVISGAGTVNLNMGSNDITIEVKAENGSVRQYVIHILKQQGGPTYDASVSGNSNSSVQVTGPGSSQSGTEEKPSVILISPAGN